MYPAGVGSDSRSGLESPVKIAEPRIPECKEETDLAILLPGRFRPFQVRRMSMHEMSIAEALIRIVEAEMAKHGLRRVDRITVRHGELSTMVPEALDLAFEVMTRGTVLEGAVLEYDKVPLTLQCAACQATFSPEVHSLHFAPCPSCGEEFAHVVLAGKELNIAHIEGDT